MQLAPDIIKHIESVYRNPTEVSAIVSAVAAPEAERVIRCILHLSEGDRDSLMAYVKMADQDYRDVIWNAEYDNRNIRKYNFTRPLDEQKPYSEKE